MAAPQLQLVIHSPEKELFSGDVDSIRIETELGEMEILPDHVSMIGSLLFSPIRVKQGEHDWLFYVRQGIVTVVREKEQVTIIGLSCDKDTEVDHKTIKEYMDFILDKLEKDEDLSDVQIKFLQEQKASLERLIDVVEK